MARKAPQNTCGQKRVKLGKDLSAGSGKFPGKQESLLISPTHIRIRYMYLSTDPASFSVMLHPKQCHCFPTKPSLEFCEGDRNKMGLKTTDIIIPWVQMPETVLGRQVPPGVGKVLASVLISMAM